MTRILVIDDETDIRQAVALMLARGGYEVVEAANGREGLRRFHADTPDLVLLDVAMPELDGWQTLDRIRDMSEVPVLMLTARGLESDRVRGLDAGADDYLVKPFGGQELLARVRALLRRVTAAPEVRDSIEHGDLVLDLLQRRVVYDGAEIKLTPLEFRVLQALASHPGNVLSEEQLLERAWNDPSEVGVERVKFVIHRLRRKLAAAGVPEGLIESVRASGYRFRP
ncbi:MAG: response regulator transcription factor [Dehalococcoidia bacterium]|nr:response regulator transcription factor [Dehalococcoidia bacterium]